MKFAVTNNSFSPVPGDDGLIRLSNITGGSLTLTWTMAADAESPQSVLEYRVSNL